MSEIGNKNGVKLKDPEVRQDAYKDFCEWIAKGKSRNSFYYDKNGLMCTHRTIERYIKENPSEFRAIQEEIAMAKGYAYWEQIVEDSATGVNEKANTASLQMKMRNQFRWDKRDEEPTYRHETDMEKVLEKWEKDGSKSEAARQPESLERKD